MKLLQMPTPEQALPGRDTAMPVPAVHAVLGSPLCAPFPSNFALAMFGMGCFWGAEKKYWQLVGVHTTVVGYAAGYTPNPLYEEVCSGQTGHNEVVLVVFDPAVVTYGDLLKVFWEGHNPTLGMRQGNDIGTQYRSGIYCFSEEQLELATASRVHYQRRLDEAGSGRVITTEVMMAPVFYCAEPYHQQYLAKNPGGYCPDISCHATGLPVFSC